MQIPCVSPLTGVNSRHSRPIRADIAQMVERARGKGEVSGSTPDVGTRFSIMRALSRAVAPAGHGVLFSLAGRGFFVAALREIFRAEGAY